MATTKNHKITKTLRLAIEYAVADKIEESLRDDVLESIAYTIDDKTGKVTYPTLHSTLNCGSNVPYDMFQFLIQKYGQDELKYGNRQSKNSEPILAWHFHQNFEGQVDPKIANEIGQKLAQEMFPNFPVVIGTHTNTSNTHNHIIICAWNLDGKKWHQHNAEYRRLREVSDRLCDEYGLPVLDATRKQKLFRFQDEDGHTRYYEPTERKNEIIRQRESGEVSPDDVGSYRNSFSYEHVENKKETNREIISRDIDRLLPVATSYEDLLQRLRQAGYTIKDKKKNGEYLEHITFQPPLAEKGTRDNNISDDMFYIRENLERVIADFEAQRAAEKQQAAEQTEPEKPEGLERQEAPEPEKKTPPYFENYIYGETIIDDIDEDVRTVKDADGSFSTVERGEPERVVIRDVKKADSELHLLDTTELDRLIREQRQKEKSKMQERPGGISKRREEFLVAQIQESFHVLRFMEQEKILSRSQLNDFFATQFKEYNRHLKGSHDLENAVSQLEQILQAPDKAKVVEARIERMRDNRDYLENEYPTDKKYLSTYRDTIARYNLTNPEKVKLITEKVAEGKKGLGKFAIQIEYYKSQLEEFDRCVSVLNRIDKEAGRDSGEISKNISSSPTQQKHSAPPEKMQKKRNAYER